MNLWQQIEGLCKQSLRGLWAFLSLGGSYVLQLCSLAFLALSGDLTRAPPSQGFEAGARLSASEIDVVHEKVQM